MTYDELLAQVAHGGIPAIRWYDRLSDWMLTATPDDFVIPVLNFFFPETEH